MRWTRCVALGSAIARSPRYRHGVTTGRTAIWRWNVASAVTCKFGDAREPDLRRRLHPVRHERTLRTQATYPTVQPSRLMSRRRCFATSAEATHRRDQNLFCRKEPRACPRMSTFVRECCFLSATEDGATRERPDSVEVVRRSDSGADMASTERLALGLPVVIAQLAAPEV